MSDSIRHNLTAIRRHIWSELQRALPSFEHPWHVGFLATVTPAGSPDVRTLVLRGVDKPRRELIAWTDRRASKVDQMQHDARVVWLFYDPQQRVQLRCIGHVSVHFDDSLADAQWQACSVSSRRAYLSPQPPGVPIDEPSIENDDTTEGRAHFAVIRTEISELDWLSLHDDGNRRARFVYEADGVIASWITP